MVKSMTVLLISRRNIKTNIESFLNHVWDFIKNSPEGTDPAGELINQVSNDLVIAKNENF